MSAQGPVMILAGGTGGHIFPGLAVAQVLRERGVEVRWMGARDAMETRLVPQHHIAIDTIPVKGVRGKGIGALAAMPFKLMRAIIGARAILARYRPRAVISFGGYAAGPGGIAARWLGIPLLVHEQNRAAGMTNKTLARFAKVVMTGFPDTFEEETVVGNPVREVIAKIEAPSTRLNRGEHTLRVLVLGGSQGARALNEAVPVAIAKSGLKVEVRHQCGERQADEARAAYAAAGVEASVEPFITDMAQAYAWADLLVCRAGALTLAEVCAAGVASVLVPFPQAVDDHQTRNARFLVDHGAAVLLAQGDNLAENLTGVLRDLGQDDRRRLGMSLCARTLARPDAAARVADLALEAAA